MEGYVAAGHYSNEVPELLPDFVPGLVPPGAVVRLVAPSSD